MLTIGDLLTVGSILAIGRKLGAQLEDVIQSIPSIVPVVLQISQQAEERLTDLKYRPQLYETLTIDLSTARDKEKYDISGSCIIAQDITSDATLSIIFNQKDNQAVTIDRNQRSYVIEFQSFYVTNTAQTGKSVSFLVGKGEFAGSAIQSIDISAQSIGNLTIDIAAQSVGNLTIDIVAQTIGNLTISVNAATIMTPIDVQGAYIMMPVDIQAQYVTLNIDIVAQTVGNIGIDIKAQTVGNINVNLAASDVTINVSVTGTASIQITAQTVGVSLKPEWETKEGNYKAIEAGSTNIASGGQTYSDYTVPTGKTLYLCMFSAQSGGTSAADRDIHQMLEVRIESPIGTNKLVAGGNGGFISPINPPIKITEGETIRVRIVNWSNHIVDARSFVTGYEV